MPHPSRAVVERSGTSVHPLAISLKQSTVRPTRCSFNFTVLTYIVSLNINSCAEFAPNAFCPPHAEHPRLIHPLDASGYRLRPDIHPRDVPEHQPPRRPHSPGRTKKQGCSFRLTRCSTSTSRSTNLLSTFGEVEFERVDFERVEFGRVEFERHY